MTKQAFLDALSKRLSGIPQEDRSRSVEYYSEMIEEHIDNGLAEEEAVAALGDMEEIVNQILEEIPLSKIVRERMRPQRKISALEMVLICVGSPVWLSLLVAAVAIVISIYASIWSVIISVFATTIALLITGVAAFPAALFLYIMRKNPLFATCMLGAGAVCAGVGILFLYVCGVLFKGGVFLGAKILLATKRCFVKKGVEQ